MATTLPRLRGDLIVSRQESNGDVRFVVKDPLQRRYFRLQPPEYFIARQLDGSTSAEEIRAGVEKEFDASLSAEELDGFIKRLEKLGILESSDRPRKTDSGLGSRLRGTLLYLRYSVFDPDDLLNRLDARLRFLYTRGFVVFSLLLAALALGVTVLHSGEMVLQLSGSFGFEMVLLAWSLSVLSVVAHEFAHGLTCKRFGGEVHEMGFLLLFFIPCLYCNVSDAWLIPEKSKRMWVTFAGAYCDLVIWSLATIAWRITAPESVFNYFALVLLATAGIKNVFNLNPLIKFDGYYLLSDYLEIPNLQRKAFAYFAARSRHANQAARAALAGLGRRERRILATYGALSGLYIAAVLSLLVFYLGGYLVENFQAFGLVLFSTIMVVMVRLRIPRASRSSGTPTDSPNVSAASPSWRSAAASRLRGLSRRARIGASVALAALLLIFLDLELKVGGEFTVLPIHNADVRAEVEGIIAEVYVEEGSQVAKDGLVARLSDRVYRAEAAKVEAELAEKTARVNLLLAGTRPEAIELAEREAATARTRLQHAKERFEEATRIQHEALAQTESLVKLAEERLAYGKQFLKIAEESAAEGLIAQKELQESQEEAAIRARVLEQAIAERNSIQANELSRDRTEWAVAGEELAEAESNLTLLRAGSRPEEIAAVKAEVSRLEAQRDYLRRQIELLEIRSPSSGIVTTEKLKEKVGRFVERGELIAEVHQLTTVEAEIAVPEKEIGEVSVGQKVLIKARAFPELTFEGRVAAIAPVVTEAETGSRVRTLRVRTLIENSDGLLKGRMTGHAKIYCGRRPVYELLSRRLVRHIRVEFWSWW